MKININKLVDEFADFVQKQNNCINKSDSKKGNSYAKRYIQVGKRLLSGGEESIDAFTTLLKHENEFVRGEAAAFLLKDRTDLAVETLKPLSKGKGLAAIGAQMTLERYEKGQLELL